MKNFFVLALMSLMIFAVSCGKTEETPSIEGTWHLKGVYDKDGANAMKECDSSSSIEFSKETFTEYYSCYSSVGEGTYSIENNILTRKYKQGHTEKNYFSIKENTLTIEVTKNTEKYRYIYKK